MSPASNPGSEGMTSGEFDRLAIAAGLLATVVGCVSAAQVDEAPRFPLGGGGVYVSARDAATASAVRQALIDAGLTLTDVPEKTRLVVVPVEGNAQLGFHSGSCGTLRNRRWEVYSSVPQTASRQSTRFQEGAFSETEQQTFAMGNLVLTITSKAYDRTCPSHPESAYDEMARELARFLPAQPL